MSRFTYGVSAVLGLAGTAIGVAGIVIGEFKPVAIGLILISGATVFAVLYLGAHWRSAATEGPASGRLDR